MRVERSLAAAQAKLDVADLASASELLAAAEARAARRAPARAAGAAGRADRVRRAGAGATRRRCCSRRPGGSNRLDAAMARETYLEAIASAMFAGRLGSGPDEREVAEAARAANRAPAAGAADLLLDALVTRFTEGYAAAVAAALAGAARVRRARRRWTRTGAGCGWPAASRRISGTTSSGTCSRPAACASRATPARSPAPERAQLPRRAQRSFGGVRHRRGADRRGRRDHAGDRASRRSSTQPACWPRRAATRRRGADRVAAGGT